MKSVVSLKQVISFLMWESNNGTFFILFNHLSSAILNSFEWLCLEKQIDSLFTLQEMCIAWHCITAWHTAQIWHFVSFSSDFNVDMMNTLTFKVHTNCVCLHEKQSDQMIPLHAIPTTLRQSSLIPAKPLNFHPKQMFFFFGLHNTSNPTQTLPLAAWFQVSSNLKFNSTRKALPTLLIFNWTCE